MKLADLNVVFNSCGHAMDDKKNLYRVVDGECIFIGQMKKHAYQMAEHDGRAYLVDSFGDCFVLENRPVFVAGITGAPRFFSVYDDRIFLRDSYDRLWVHQLDGKLLRIIFAPDSCIEVVLRKNYIGLLCGPTSKPPFHLHLVDRGFRVIYSDQVDAVPSFADNEIGCLRRGSKHEITVIRSTSQN